jgi:hypothetical protein
LRLGAACPSWCERALDFAAIASHRSPSLRAGSNFASDPDLAPSYPLWIQKSLGQSSNDSMVRDALVLVRDRFAIIADNDSAD